MRGCAGCLVPAAVRRLRGCQPALTSHPWRLHTPLASSWRLAASLPRCLTASLLCCAGASACRSPEKWTSSAAAPPARCVRARSGASSPCWRRRAPQLSASRPVPTDPAAGRERQQHPRQAVGHPQRPAVGGWGGVGWGVRVRGRGGTCCARVCGAAAVEPLTASTSAALPAPCAATASCRCSWPMLSGSAPSMC